MAVIGGWLAAPSRGLAPALEIWIIDSRPELPAARCLRNLAEPPWRAGRRDDWHMHRP
jgi:hypothetical protein